MLHKVYILLNDQTRINIFKTWVHVLGKFLLLYYICLQFTLRGVHSPDNQVKHQFSCQLKVSECLRQKRGSACLSAD